MTALERYEDLFRIKTVNRLLPLALNLLLLLASQGEPNLATPLNPGVDPPGNPITVSYDPKKEILTVFRDLEIKFSEPIQETFEGKEILRYPVVLFNRGEKEHSCLLSHPRRDNESRVPAFFYVEILSDKEKERQTQEAAKEGKVPTFPHISETTVDKISLGPKQGKKFMIQTAKTERGVFRLTFAFYLENNPSRGLLLEVPHHLLPVK